MNPASAQSAAGRSATARPAIAPPPRSDAEIVVGDVVKSCGPIKALRRVSLTSAASEFVTITVVCRPRSLASDTSSLASRASRAAATPRGARGGWRDVVARAPRGENSSSATISVRLGVRLFRSAVNGYRAA